MTTTPPTNPRQLNPAGYIRGIPDGTRTATALAELDADIRDDVLTATTALLDALDAE
jgi:hypothetical protein